MLRAYIVVSKEGTKTAVPPPGVPILSVRKVLKSEKLRVFLGLSLVSVMRSRIDIE